MTSRQLHSTVFGPCGFEDQTLVEISGPPKSGRSLVLQQLIAHCVAPYAFGGRQWSIYLINLSHKITRESLTKVVRAELQAFSLEGKPPAAEELTEIAKECVARVSFMKCFTTADVKYTLFNIPYETLRDRSVELIAIDTLSEFYWLDAAERKQNLTKYRYYRQCQMHLNRICKEALVCGMYTVDSSFLNSKYNEKIAGAKVDYNIQMSKLRGNLAMNRKSVSFSNGIIEIRQ
ncbi:DNA repair protein XRCC2 [Drosophila serrata]|uniref:DNA repair protein XRCC2 n=1 Tax=Drosophila serrata TaxID=7274 RepID=UPI000A1D03DD|nr:DNA repair protein XRCC2 [Drosophila serrata]KAH8355972.1 hypothetical protein KR200_004575 [Drosophila serrata]